MRIALIRPKYRPSLWNLDFCKNITQSKYPFPPLACATVAGIIGKEHQVSIIDENIEAIPFDSHFDIVGISGLWIQRQRVFEIAAEFKKRNRAVVIGGPMTSSDTELCAAHGDSVFAGEAEYTFPQYLRDFENGTTKKIYRQNDPVDMERSPVPRFDLLKVDRYVTMTMQSSRGCPFRCKFCEIPIVHGRKTRKKSREQIIKEIDILYDLRAEGIFIADDNFTGNRKHVLDFLNALKANMKRYQRAVYFYTQASMEITKDEEILRLLYETNFKRLFLGMESPNPKNLESMNKYHNLGSDLEEGISRLHRYNIIPWAGMILGLDHDTRNMVEEQFEFIQKNHIPLAIIGPIVAIPNAPIYQELKAENRLLESDEILLGLYGEHEIAFATNVVPKNMTVEELMSACRELGRKLYDYEPFADRLIGALALHQNPARKEKGSFSWEKIGYLIKFLRHFYFTGDKEKKRFFKRIFRFLKENRWQGAKEAFIHMILFAHLREFYFRD